MLTISDARGVIFDVDDTLLNTFDDNPLTALHNRARVEATRAAGRRHDLAGLAALTPEMGHRMFHEAPVHSVAGAVWHTLFTFGIVPTEEIDRNNSLLREIIADKEAAYEKLLRTEAKPYPGAVAFVKWAAENGLKDYMAIASTAIRRDIDIFLEMAGLSGYFPSDRIISHDDLTHAKPDPEAFDKAFLSLHLPESDRRKVIAFEDNPRGIVSAQRAGLLTCAITNIYSREDLQAMATPPDCIAGSFREFRQILTPAPA